MARLNKLQVERDEAMHQLQKQAKEVVGPLIEQVKDRESELTILRKKNAK